MQTFDYTVKAAQIVKIRISLHTALSPALVWKFCVSEPHIDW